jgi:cysteine synthase A
MPLPAQVASNPLDLIGNTPLLELRRMASAGSARIMAKLESMNPGGSVKDRICLAMIEAAEAEGRLKPGSTILEPTSGNTGIGLAMVAAARGYRCILTMPDTMSEERRTMLRAYGAELVLTPDSKGMHAAIRKAQEILEEHPDYFMPQQFTNPANPAVHARTTAREILADCPDLDAFVAGVGTGGTVTGVGTVLKRERAGVQIIAVEPAGSPVLSGGEPGFHAIQGLGAGFVPEILDRNVIDRVIPVTDEAAAECTRALARTEGILVGISSGANCVAAMQLARELGRGRTVVAVFCDTGQRYLSTTLYDPGGSGGLA